jgi:hypothetical protein
VSQQVRVDEVFARDWIQRGWTFQELILSSNPIVVCGDKTLAWEDLTNFIIAHEDYFGSDPNTTRFDVLGKGPRMSADKFASWSSAIQLWLTFTRPGLSSNNLVKLVRIDQANRRFQDVKLVVGGLLILPAGFVYLAVTGVLIMGISRAIAGAGWSDRGFMNHLTVQLLSFIVFAPLHMKLATTIMVACWDVLFGLRPPWSAMAGSQPPQEAGGPGMLHIEGVRVALRERDITLPHDKAFSVMAILQLLGSDDVDIDYRRPLSECFQHLFVAIVKLHPPALQMLCDAGLSPGSDTWSGPSWVPNWMVPRPNGGASSQLCIPPMRLAGDSNFGPGDQYQIDGDSLRVSGAGYVGQISFHDRSDEQAMIDPSPLQRICMWYCFIRNNSVLLPQVTTDYEEELKVPEQYHDSVVFAALEGIPCSRRVQPVYFIAEEERRRYMNFKSRRPPFKAPFDFSKLKAEFDDFLKFKALLEDACSAEQPSGPSNIARLLSGKLQRNSAATRYYRRLIAKLEKDERAFIAVSGWHRCLVPDGSVYETGKVTGDWVGTAPLATMPGDHVFQLPKTREFMVLRQTSRHGEFRVVGCALLPIARLPGMERKDITLV